MQMMTIADHAACVCGCGKADSAMSSHGFRLLLTRFAGALGIPLAHQILIAGQATRDGLLWQRSMKGGGNVP